MITGLDATHGAPVVSRDGASPMRGSGARSFAAELARAFDAIDRGDGGRIDAATADAPGALLEIQMAVYRHAERLELASKIVDYAVGSVKTILQTRV
jgi:hypothetical protein